MVIVTCPRHTLTYGLALPLVFLKPFFYAPESTFQEHEWIHVFTAIKITTPLVKIRMTLCLPLWRLVLASGWCKEGCSHGEACASFCLSPPASPSFPVSVIRSPASLRACRVTRSLILLMCWLDWWMFVYLISHFGFRPGSRCWPFKGPAITRQCWDKSQISAFHFFISLISGTVIVRFLKIFVAFSLPILFISFILLFVSFFYIFYISIIFLYFYYYISISVIYQNVFCFINILFGFD